jgi:hypothetical protein
MKVRTIISTSATSLAIVASFVFGAVAPAAADSTATIPSCSTMLVSTSTPDYWTTFATINGDTAVRYSPSPTLLGSTHATLKHDIRAWNGKNCSWRLSHSKKQNFTVSETKLTKARSASLQKWFSSHGIAGVDSEATLGGVLYQVNATEWHLLMHDKVWIAIKARGTDLFGYTMQSAAYRIVDLNPWLFV